MMSRGEIVDSETLFNVKNRNDCGLLTPHCWLVGRPTIGVAGCASDLPPVVSIANQFCPSTCRESVRRNCPPHQRLNESSLKLMALESREKRYFDFTVRATINTTTSSATTILIKSSQRFPCATGAGFGACFEGWPIDWASRQRSSSN